MFLFYHHLKLQNLKEVENNIAYLTKKGKAISKETYELLRSVKGES